MTLAATGSGYLTLQSSCTLENVDAVAESEIPVTDAQFTYPFGLIAFRAPCASATFSLYLHGGSLNAAIYRKYGPLPPGGPAQWYTLPGTAFTTATVGEPVFRVERQLTRAASHQHPG